MISNLQNKIVKIGFIFIAKRVCILPRRPLTLRINSFILLNSGKICSAVLINNYGLINNRRTICAVRSLQYNPKKCSPIICGIARNTICRNATSIKSCVKLCIPICNLNTFSRQRKNISFRICIVFYSKPTTSNIHRI